MKKESFLIPLLLILIWQGLSFTQIIPSYKLPSPVEIVLGFKDLLIVGVPPGNLLHNHMIYSLYRVALGYAIAALVAIPLGLLMGWSPLGDNRLPNFQTIDFRVDKPFTFYGRLKVMASMDVFNLMNGNTSLSIRGRQNASNANQISSLLAPRVIRFGFRATW